MSDEYRTERVLGAFADGGGMAGYPMPRRRGYGAYGTGHTAPRAPIQDMTSVFGQSAAALPEAVQEGLQRILGELAALHQQLDVARHQRHSLEDRADHYPDLPCLNGYAFVRELDAFLDSTATRDQQDWGYVAMIHVDGIEAAVARWGIAAADMAQRQVWETLYASSISGEPLAYLGYGSFCWLLIGADAVGRVDVLLDALRALPLVFGEHPIPLTPTAGLAPLQSGQGAVAALEAAEAVRVAQNS